MTVKDPTPLPEWTDRFVQPDGRLSDNFYRWAWDLDKVMRAVVADVNTPAPPDPEYELIEPFSALIPFPADKDYTLILKSPAAFTITETVTKCVSGTATATFKINSTALGGTANSVSSSEQSQAHATNNEVAVGDDIVLTISANSACVDLSLTIKGVRTLTT